MAEDLSEEQNKWVIKEKIPNVPDFGWRVKLSYKCKVKCDAFQIPSLNLALPLVPFELRFVKLLSGQNNFSFAVYQFSMYHTAHTRH
jgi:hypothetical protein